MSEEVFPLHYTEFTRRFSRVPPTLCAKVNGDAGAGGFHSVGLALVRTINDELAAHAAAGGIGPKNFGRARKILDFGAGLGRVVRHLLEWAPKTEITAFDLDPLMLRHGAMLVDSDEVRWIGSLLDEPDEHYDLILAISVFTHLDGTARWWLSEIERLLSPDGLAVISFHDESLFSELRAMGQLPPAAQLEAGIYVDGVDTPEGGARMGTFHTCDCFRQLVEERLEICLIKPRGLFGHQSLVIAKRKADAQGGREALQRDYLRSLERELAKLRESNDIRY